MKVVTGSKTTMFTPEKALGEGLHQAGTGQVTIFAMEEVIETNIDMWMKYAGEMGLKAKGLQQLAGETHTAIEGFVNGLATHYFNPECRVFVAYSILDPEAITWANYEFKRDNIQMAMTVCTDKDDAFPAVTHMGIFRSPLLALDRAAYQARTSRRIALELHSFAAKGLRLLRPNCRPKLMITAPMKKMSELLGAVGSATMPHKKATDGRQTTNVTFTHEQAEHSWSRDDHRWILDLAFNSQHGLPTSATEFQALAAQHQDMRLQTIEVAE